MQLNTDPPLSGAELLSNVAGACEEDLRTPRSSAAGTAELSIKVTALAPGVPFSWQRLGLCAPHNSFPPLPATLLIGGR